MIDAKIYGAINMTHNHEFKLIVQNFLLRIMTPPPRYILLGRGQAMYAPISNQIFKINKLLSLLTLQKIQWTKWRTWKLISIKDDDKHSDIIVLCQTSTCFKKLTSSSLATETANCVLHFTSVARFVTKDNKQTKKDKGKTS